jgi:hypothetical protein
LAVPPRAEVPAAQPPGQTTAESPAQAPTAVPAAAPVEPAPVSAAPPPGGVTQLPQPPSQPTSSTSYAATGTGAGGRSYGAGNFGLTLDGTNAGFLKAVEGGAATADVVIEKAGPDNISKKHVAGIKYEELSLTVGFDSRPITDWIAATWNGTFSRKSGSVQLADYQLNIRGERQFANALLTGTTIPALDGSSKQPSYLTLTIAPEFVREMGGSGKLQGSAGKSQKQWLPSNFRFEMGDLDGTKVSRIDSFTVGQKVVENPVGELRDYEKQPGTLVFPNLRITLAAGSSESWAKWHDDFVIKGNNGDAQEKDGSIVFLSANRQDELARINLVNCGIFRLGDAPRQANADALGLVTADLYCERMEFVARN